MTSNEHPQLAVYPQLTPGTSAFLIGNRGALLELRKTIDAALNGSVAVAYVDGVDAQRYAVVVCNHAVDGANLALPFSDPAYSERDESKTKPWDFGPIVKALTHR